MKQMTQRSWLSKRLSNNIGRNDRFFRSLVGVGMVMAGWLLHIPEIFWPGIYFIVTATFKFCPNYAIFNFNTLGDEEPKTTIPWEVFLDLLPSRGSSFSSLDSSADAAVEVANQISRVPLANGPSQSGLDTPVKKTTSEGSAPEKQIKKPAKFFPNVDYFLPPELTHALIKDIEKNALDEMLVVRFYENFFGCKISIEPAAHLNIYVCQFPHKTIRLEFSRLKAGLLDRLHESGH